MKRNIKKIGFDLDGVVIDKPPFVPRWFVEYIYRGKQPKRGLHYRYPSHKFEIILRKISHHPLFRPPLKKQASLIEKLHESRRYHIYAVTSRYSFLEDRTKKWFEYYNMDRFFREIFINTKDEQPHKFKNRLIEELDLDLFIDDDDLLLNYLKRNNKNVELLNVEDLTREFQEKLLQ